MDALVVYESMFGNTHAIAEAVATGLRSQHVVTVLPVGSVTQEEVDRAELLVVGGPTHGHGMSRPSTRQGATEQAAKGKDGLELDPGPNEPGVRSWLESTTFRPVAAAAFDTRVDKPALLTGRASKGIARRLREAGLHLVAPAESFLVDMHNRTEPGELERAEAWGRDVAGNAAASS
jgi:hypothetical protein